jgi:N-acetylmuramoyl-L-alanine amidase
VNTRRILLGHGIAASFLLVRRQGEAASPVARPHAAAPLPAVVLDPGHGGKDPGAIGVSGTYEKHVALAAAEELAALLEAEKRYRVTLTRTSDVFLPLEERVSIAQARQAALFVSMHADALTDHTVRGASVYTLAATASDAQTAALARRENSADRFADPSFHGVPPEVAEILASLVREETRRGSARIARRAVGELDTTIPMLTNPSRHAEFVVLKAADIPSVLIEMGFMSNQQDESELRTKGHRQKVAQAMKRAIDAYFGQATAGAA